MPMLRSQRRLRRDPRNRGSRKRKRRNLVKFIPEADSDFAFVASSYFSQPIMKDPKAFGLNDDDAARIAEAVRTFRLAFAKTYFRFSRNPKLVMEKDLAREKAEAIVRKYANIIRANPDVSQLNKWRLRLKKRPKKLGKRKCPRQAPQLQFIGTADGMVGGIGQGSGSGVHVLKYFDQGDDTVIVPSKVVFMNRRAKPDGAVRIELYFDMVPVGEPVPVHPGERGWPKYLRSYTRSPIEVEFPIPVNGPMLIVYWARWADSTGEVGRWSKTCVARVEGWTSNRAALPASEGSGAEAAMPQVRSDARYFIAERQVQERYMEQIAGLPLMQLEQMGEPLPVKEERRMLDAA